LIFNCLEGMSDSNVRQICEAELERQWFVFRPRAARRANPGIVI
jgi:hypothetical protein